MSKIWVKAGRADSAFQQTLPNGTVERVIAPTRPGGGIGGPNLDPTGGGPLRGWLSDCFAVPYQVTQTPDLAAAMAQPSDPNRAPTLVPSSQAEANLWAPVLAPGWSL